jgi:hypothetical protein
MSGTGSALLDLLKKTATPPRASDTEPWNNSNKRIHHHNEYSLDDISSNEKRRYPTVGQSEFRI